LGLWEIISTGIYTLSSQDYSYGTETSYVYYMWKELQSVIYSQHAYPDPPRYETICL
ncbi:hypothetical protein V3C99_010264, partial [Haemonchus contortus]